MLKETIIAMLALKTVLPRLYAEPPFLMRTLKAAHGTARAADPNQGWRVEPKTSSGVGVRAPNNSIIADCNDRDEAVEAWPNKARLALYAETVNAATRASSGPGSSDFANLLKAVADEGPEATFTNQIT
jgi:hypothetical protein